MRNIKILVEKHCDGFVAYPLGVKGIVVGEGDTYDQALADTRSALRFHRETFDAFHLGSPQGIDSIAGGNAPGKHTKNKVRP